MSTDRRDFLKLSAAAGGALGLGLLPGCSDADGSAARDAAPAGGDGAQERAPRSLRILVLGGTGFIGPPMVQYAVDRGHEVTLFNRGRSNTDLFPDLENLIGDRNDDVSALEGRTWDICIDNNASSGRAPWWVELTANTLRDSVDRYYFVSTRSTYADVDVVPMDASQPTRTFESEGVDPSAESLSYGLAKAEAERRALEIIGEARVGIFRPGLIIGPGDETDRFTYWPVRIHEGGEVLAPSDGTDPIQIIDVRDLVEWMIRMAEAEETGIYNCVGPRYPRPISELLYGIRAVTTAETVFTWVDTDFLLERGVRPYGDLPVWRPPEQGAGFARFDLTNEVERGLTFRPLATTAADTLEYHFSRPAERQAEVRPRFLGAEEERELLDAWHARPGAEGPRWLPGDPVGP